jgi:hypothetical protein
MWLYCRKTAWRVVSATAIGRRAIPRRQEAVVCEGAARGLEAGEGGVLALSFVAPAAVDACDGAERLLSRGDQNAAGCWDRRE